MRREQCSLALRAVARWFLVVMGAMSWSGAGMALGAVSRPSPHAFPPGVPLSGLRLQTADTAVGIAVRHDHVALVSLQCRNTGWDWAKGAAGGAPPEIPFIRSALVRGREVTLTWRFSGLDAGTGNGAHSGSPRHLVFLFS